jgi:AcrR family transcriptional regulator
MQATARNRKPAGAEPPPIARGAAPIGDPILDAAATCIQRKGFDNTSLEEIAAEAGVSRTTLYRRYGNRELLFKALLIERAKPFRAWSRQILVGPGTVQERIEIVLAHAILEMQRVGWLDRTLHAGMSAAAIRLFKAAHADSAETGLAPLLASLMDERATEAGVTVAELVEWTADQMIVLASAAPWDEKTLRSRLLYFVMPVLAPPPHVGVGTEARLAGIEQRLDTLIARAEGSAA